MLPSLMRPAAAVINHLLTQEPWAQARLAAHRGKTACIDVGGVKLMLTVCSDGLVEQAADGTAPAVTIHLRPADFPLLLADRQRAVSYVRIEGDADFANTMSQLSQTLRWDAEEDIGRLVGDIAAARMVSAAKTVVAVAQSTQKHVAENVAEYFLEEQPMLIRPYIVSEFSEEVVRLRDQLERLTKRIEKLERR